MQMKKKIQRFLISEIQNTRFEKCTNKKKQNSAKAKILQFKH